MPYAYKTGQDWKEIGLEGFTIDNVQHSGNWPDLVSTAEAAAIGVKLITETPPPSNVKLNGSRIVDVNNSPVREYIVVPYTPQEAAAIMWERAKVVREFKAYSTAPVTLDGIEYRADADDKSRINLSGLVQMAQIKKAANEPFTMVFTMAKESNNAQVTLDSDGIISLGFQVGAHVGNCHLVSQGVRLTLMGAVSAGTSAAAIFLIPIDAGYP